MGMDIYGLAPITRSEKPVIDWDLATPEERNHFYELDSKYHAMNPGVYFRANIWSWRPIANIILHVNDIYRLEFPSEFITRIHYNDGAGLKTQEECDKLANFIEIVIDDKFKNWKSIGYNSGFYSKTVVTSKGDLIDTFTRDDESRKVELFLAGEEFIKDGVIEYDNLLYTTTHNVSIDHLKTFVTFLRECGGFEIR